MYMTTQHRSRTPAKWPVNELDKQVSGNEHDNSAQVTDSSTVIHEWISLVSGNNHDKWAQVTDSSMIHEWISKVSGI